MAIAKMSRLRILGLKSDKNAIMNELIESGAFEAVPSVSGKENFVDRSHLEKAFARQAKVAFAIEFLDKCADEYESMRFAAAKKGNAALAEFPETEIKKSGGRKIIGYDDFYDVAAKEYELGAVCDELEKLSFARLENKSETAKLRQKIRALQPYEKFPLPLGVLSDGANAIQKSKNKVKAIEPYSAFPLKFSQLGDGESVSVMLAFHPSGAAVSFGDYPAFTEKYPCASGSLTGVIVRLCDKEKAVAALSSAGYSLCALTDNSTAEQLLGSYGEEIRAAETKSKEALLFGLENTVRRYRARYRKDFRRTGVLVYAKHVHSGRVGALRRRGVCARKDKEQNGAHSCERGKARGWRLAAHFDSEQQNS